MPPRNSQQKPRDPEDIVFQEGPEGALTIYSLKRHLVGHVIQCALVGHTTTKWQYSVGRDETPTNKDLLDAIKEGRRIGKITDEAWKGITKKLGISA